jgi:hypothetical protein
MSDETGSNGGAGLGFLFMAALEPRLRRAAGLRLHQA